MTGNIKIVVIPTAIGTIDILILFEYTALESIFIQSVIKYSSKDLD